MSLFASHGILNACYLFEMGNRNKTSLSDGTMTQIGKIKQKQRTFPIKPSFLR